MRGTGWQSFFEDAGPCVQAARGELNHFLLTSSPLPAQHTCCRLVVLPLAETEVDVAEQIDEGFLTQNDVAGEASWG